MTEYKEATLHCLFRFIAAFSPRATVLLLAPATAESVFVTYCCCFYPICYNNSLGYRYYPLERTIITLLTFKLLSFINTRGPACVVLS